MSTAIWVLVGIVVGWTLAGWLTGFTSPWRQLWHWMRGHPIKATTVVLAIVVILGQFVFGWWVHKSQDPPPCEAQKMAQLPQPDRNQISAQYQSDQSAARVPIPVSKPDLQAAVDAIDAWVDNNSSVYNQAIPLPARVQMTTKEKANLLLYVVRRRYQVS